MKSFQLSIVVCLLLFSSCSTDKTRRFMPGVYVSSVNGEYSVADDTLRVVQQEGYKYLIQRSTGFNRISDGVKGKRELEKETWYARYDPGTHTLIESKWHKELSFYPDSGLLRVVGRAYRKVGQ